VPETESMKISIYSRSGRIASLAIFAAAGVAVARQDSATDPWIEGVRLAASLRAASPLKASTNTAVLKIRTPEGRRQVPIRVVTEPREARWTVRYATTGPGPEEVLTVTHTTNAAPVFERRLSGTNAPARSDTAFAGSDFCLGDLGLEFLHWPRQRVVGRELSAGQWCRVLESASLSPEGPASVRSWIDERHGVILNAEAYDARQVRLKYFAVTNFREVDDQWMFGLSIVDDRKGTKTELTYDPPSR
jgi:hypothetical protein